MGIVVSSKLRLLYPWKTQVSTTNLMRGLVDFRASVDMVVLAQDWVSNLLQTLAALPQTREPTEPPNRRLDGYQSMPGCCKDEKYLLPCQVLNHNPLVAQPTA